MELGFVGLGKMGGNMVRRLLLGGHKITGFDPDSEAVNAATKEGALPAGSLAELVERLRPPRLVWLMVPAGKVTDQVIADLVVLLDSGDVIADGGNSFYKDAALRSGQLAEKGISFLDVGTSGGIWGLKEGYCLMVGGEEKAFKIAEPAFRSLAPKNGYAHVGPSGAGHYVKMVHNAIEYIMLEGYGEGFELLNAKKEFALDLKQVSELWGNGSVVRSWLLELAAAAFAEDPDLESIKAYVEDTGEGRWAAIEAIEASVPAPGLAAALGQRFRSRQEDSFAARFIAAERRQFGGHAMKSKKA